MESESSRLLAREDLYPLEEYARMRVDFRAQVMAHKLHRKLPIGENVTLLFEDRLTIQYQVQEMLRVERIFEEAAILEELAAYNPLIPNGSNWKATMLIEYAEVAERQLALTELVGIEDRIWVSVPGLPKIYAVADEDLDRSTADKTSAVHFLRFELSAAMVEALKQGARPSAGSDHPKYACETQIPDLMLASLIADLD